MATLTEQLNQQTEQVNKMYDANKAAQLANLQNAYNQNLSNAQASMQQINPQYQQRANDLAVQYERNRRNLNEQAAARGLNTGTASQQQLALNNVWNRDYGNLRVAQQNALNEAQRGIDNLTSTYNTDVNAAAAQNDYQRAQALLNQYKTNYQNQLTLAANLAKYGDFSGYKGIYDDAQIGTMRNNWIASNPDLAYRTGTIDANRYHSMTGNWPAGYTPPSSGGGGYYGGGGLTAQQQLERDIREKQADPKKYTNREILSSVEGAYKEYGLNAKQAAQAAKNTGIAGKSTTQYINGVPTQYYPR